MLLFIEEECFQHPLKKTIMTYKKSLLLLCMIVVFLIQTGMAQSKKQGESNFARATPFPAELEVENDAIEDNIAIQNFESTYGATMLLFTDTDDYGILGILNSNESYLSSTPGDVYLTTNLNSQSLLLATEQIERMRVTGDGDVGIGTTVVSDGAKVEVNSNADFIDFEPIFKVDMTGAAGTITDAIAIQGRNSIDDYFGTGVRGDGGFVGVIGVVQPTGGQEYFGVLGSAIGGDGTGINYGVYGEASGNGTNYAGYFNGDLQYTGTLNPPSDKKLKRNISEVDHALDYVMNLTPKSYEYDQEKYKTMNLAKGKQFGFVAQEVQEIFPNLVKNNVHAGTDKSVEQVEYLGVNYIGLIPILTRAMQELFEEKEELKQQVEIQENRLATLEALVASLLEKK